MSDTRAVPPEQPKASPSTSQPSVRVPAPMQGTKPMLGWAVFGVVAVVAFGLGLLLMSVFQRRQEAAVVAQVITPIAEDETNPEVWGRNYPREYDRWLGVTEPGETKWGGNTGFSWLERDPLLAELWAGYPHSIEYNDDRGHILSLEDVRATARIDPTRGGALAPATCMTCKSSEVPILMQEMGIAEFYSLPFNDVEALAQHPVSCSDCHDPNTMHLRITRPAIREAFTRMGRDIDEASPQEMRSLVCAQCHAEYYFAPSASSEQPTYLTFPWRDIDTWSTNPSAAVEAICNYYTEDERVVDWEHPVSGAPLVKMQHPDYELYAGSLHASRNVSCADCHMPYLTEGAIKYTDHRIQSPLFNIPYTCGVCHRWGEVELRRRVEVIQDDVFSMLQRTERVLLDAHQGVAAAREAGISDGRLQASRELIRQSQMRWDFIRSSHGMGFHNPTGTMRTLYRAIDLAHQANRAIPRE